MDFFPLFVCLFVCLFAFFIIWLRGPSPIHRGTKNIIIEPYHRNIIGLQQQPSSRKKCYMLQKKKSRFYAFLEFELPPPPPDIWRKCSPLHSKEFLYNTNLRSSNTLVEILSRVGDRNLCVLKPSLMERSSWRPLVLQQTVSLLGGLVNFRLHEENRSSHLTIVWI